MNRAILVIDDNTTMREAVCHALTRKGYRAIPAESGESGLPQVTSGGCNLVVTDLRLPGWDGIEVLKRVKQIDQRLPVILITAYGTVESAVAAMQLGAADYILKPFNHSELLLRVERALRLVELERQNQQLTDHKNSLLEELQGSSASEPMIGSSSVLHQIRTLIPKVAARKASVLILGESGVGKELVARMIHHASPRRAKAFVKVDCGILAEGILESELFGHERGAFTGAMRRHIGRFELADGGTLLLDEIGNISQTMQIKLLRVLQEGEFQRVGGENTIAVDVRIIAATNQDLPQLVKSGRFREDLYYRLNVVTITVPPLRERVADIPELAQHFLAGFNQEMSRTIKGFAPDVLTLFTRYQWPGNIRELRNWIEHGMVLADGDMITLNDLPKTVLGSMTAETQPSALLNIPEGQHLPLGPTLENLERHLIHRAMEAVRGNKTAAARLLDITTSTLYYKLVKYGLYGGEDHDHT